MSVSRTVSDVYNSYFDSNISVEVGKEADGTSVNGAMRFTNITISQGTTIQNANLGFKVGTKGSGSGDLQAKIYGIDEDNTGSFSGSPLGRTRTDAYDQASWSLPPQGEFSNHNVTSIVQEIINRSGWSSGNAIGFHILDNGSPTNVWIYDTNGSKLDIVLPSASASASKSASKSASSSPSKSLSPSSSASPSGSTSSSPSPTPSRSMSQGDLYGLKISKPGFDVKTETNHENMIFTTDLGTLGWRSTQTVTGITNDEGIVELEYSHNLGYVPMVFVNVTTRDGTKIMVPNSWETTWSDTEQLSESFEFYVDNSKIYFKAYIYHYEPIQGGSSTTVPDQEYNFEAIIYFNELNDEH